MTTADSGSFTGYASFFGVVDRQGEIVDPGAFTRTLPAFRKAGLITWSHDIARPVATVYTAREDEVGLLVTGRFHSTPDAQNARTIVTERLAAGATVGLSIGYQVVRERFEGRVRHLVDLELLEVGIVMVPSNVFAEVLTAKGGKAGPVIPLTLSADPTKAREAERLRRLQIAVAVSTSRGLGVRV